MDKITIAIPTFDRPDKIRAQLSALKKQLLPGVSVLVIDNCSSQIVSDLEEANHRQIKVIRNVANVGSCANVLRCIENSCGEWVAILGDDDFIASNYVRELVAASEEWPSALAINFSSNFQDRESSYVAVGVSEVVSKLDNWANFLFISANLYKVSALKSNLRFGYHYSYSLAPHVAVLFGCLIQGGGQVVFSSKKIVEYGPADSGWPRVFQYNAAVLLEMMSNPIDRRALAKKIRVHSFSIMRVAYLCLRCPSSMGDASYLFGTRYYYYSLIRGALRLGVFGRALWCAVCARRLIVWLVESFKAVRGKRIGAPVDIHTRL